MGADAPLSDISEDKFVEFETAVLPIPQFDITNPQMISQGPSVCIFNKEDPQEVLAAWLFAQYLLSDDVQIAYAQTEGYVPVTVRAQQSESYQEYLGNCGVDNQTHYDVKIKAAKLLLEHTEDTFVTPVFNGSTSLRDAAGQMIETVTKSVRRKEEIHDEYMENLFGDMTALYRLNRSGGSSNVSVNTKVEHGPLPTASVVLLTSLAVVWGMILFYVVSTIVKKKRMSNMED